MGRPRKKKLLRLDENDPLRCLIAALGPTSKEVSFSRQQVEAQDFEETRWDALKRSKLIQAGSAEMTINCSKCEQQCMGIQVLCLQGELGYMCPNPLSIGWVVVQSKQLERIRFDRDNFIRWLIRLFDCLPFFTNSETDLAPGCHSLGIVLSGKIRLQLFLQFDIKEGWQLRVSENFIGLCDVLRFDGSEYVVDPESKKNLFWSDNSDEPPSSRAARLLEDVEWRKTHRSDYPGPIYEQVARDNGITKATLEGILKKARQDESILALKMKYRQLRKSKNGNNSLTY